jgi:hypothetical protein
MWLVQHEEILVASLHKSTCTTEVHQCTFYRVLEEGTYLRTIRD